jgi:hypothetical protein
MFASTEFAYHAISAYPVVHSPMFFLSSLVVIASGARQRQLADLKLMLIDLERPDL